MYHPYFRGKQYELITIREMADLFARSHFRPIIEPVKESLVGLEKALTAVVDAEARATVIVNPHHGDLSSAGQSVTGLLRQEFLGLPAISAGILLKQETTLHEALSCYEEHRDHSPVFVHDGFAEAKRLVEKLGKLTKENMHVFFEESCGKLYQKHFAGATRILLRDGFERMRNRDYEPIAPFSDLHITYPDENMDGFGDFLIVGNSYSESGGPAYAIAIHITFIDSDQDDSMWIHHFKSERQDSPADPAGKFGEALSSMIKELNRPKCKIVETGAIQEFRTLHQRGHFPGLGHVKKLSMNHHIETLAAFFSKQ
jgi:hypothetical protein